MDAFSDAADIFGNTRANSFDFDGFDLGDESSKEKPDISNVKANIAKGSSFQEMFSKAHSNMSFKTSGIASEYAKKAATFVGDFFGTIWKLTKQAVKMAVFKFAMEFCAMAIKTLVETVTKSGLTPSSIDTKGVFYNLANGTTPTAPTAPAPSRYDNPFSSPPPSFGMANGW